MNKIIIDNRTDLTDLDALYLTYEVVKHGRISNDGKQYSYGTLITLESREILISTDLNKKSDRFVITEYKCNHE